MKKQTITVEQLIDVNRKVDVNAVDALFNQSADLSINNNSIHYVSSRAIEELVVLTGDTEYNEIKLSAQFPLFFESQNSRYIPNKVKYAIEKYSSAAKLKSIHEDKDVAVELCLILLSNLSNAFYETESGWKRLSSVLMRDQVSNRKDCTYKKIIDLLLIGTKSGGPIIERTNNYTVGKESYRYRLTESYRNKGVSKYEFKTTYCKNLLSKQYFKQLNSAIENPIAANLIKLYQHIELPTIADIKKEAKKLIKDGYKTKKGKILTKRNKHSDSYWKDVDNRSFVEDNIELFQRLTENGYLIPTIGEDRAGGRVTDSFNLMPSWIRNLCKIDGRRIVEADYSALHPNLSIKLYKGNDEYVTHEKVAQELNMDAFDVKIEHLSFFNHKWVNMYKSPLFKYYEKNNYGMLGEMHKDKAVDYKITSRKLFSLEVDIMTSAIKKLNSEGIYVGYVYDALFTTDNNKERVTEVMNEVILEFGVHTKAK